MVRVDADEIELGDDYIWRRDGEPFTGIAEQRTPDGVLLHEDEYAHGAQDGLAWTYWPDGTRREEHWYDNGIEIRSRYWHENGQLRKDTVTDVHGVVKAFTFAEDGTLIDSFVRGLRR